MHLTRWGPPSSEAAPHVVLLHGWQDTGDTFQFVVDELARDWPLLAPDWRGFGRSEWPQDGYWFQDYFADLDALLDWLSPLEPVALVGHSMGGNVANIYAGLRPHRVRCIANLEGFGLPRSSPEQSPVQLTKWLDQVKSDPVSKDYASIDELTSIIRFRYPRFTEARAAFVAVAWSRQDGDRVRLLADMRHRRINPARYHREDAEACWRLVEAPMLMLVGEDSEFLPRLGADGSDATLRSLIPHIEIVHVSGAGHMLHIERPEVVAPLIERFLESC